MASLFYKSVKRLYDNQKNIAIADGALAAGQITAEEYVQLTSVQPQSAFEIKRDGKILKSKLALEAWLLANPYMSDVHGGEMKPYACTVEKQNLLANNYSTYVMAQQAGLTVPLTWNASGEVCEEWTGEEAFALIVGMKAYVTPRIAEQQSVEVLLQSCTTIEELDSIVVDYDNCPHAPKHEEESETPVEEEVVEEIPVEEVETPVEEPVTETTESEETETPVTEENTEAQEPTDTQEDYTVTE